MGFDWEEILGAEGDDIQRAYDDSIPDSSHSYYYDDNDYGEDDFKEQRESFAEEQEKKRQKILRQHALIENIAFEEGITEIESNAYESCTALKSVVIPEGVEIIGNSAFKGCTALENVTVPNSVKRIKASAFEGTPWLDKLISETKDNFVTLNGDIIFKYVGSEHNITIPEHIRVIADDAFSKNTFIDTVLLPYHIFRLAVSNMRSAEKWRFYEEEDYYSYLYNGNTIDYEFDVEVYESLAKEKFAKEYMSKYKEENPGCSFGKWLSDKEIYPDYVHNVSDNAFFLFGTKNVRQIIISDTVSSIDSLALSKEHSDIKNIKKVTLPCNVVHIGKKVFSSCYNLSEVVIYGSAVDIDSEAFLNCDSLENISLRSNILNEITTESSVIYFEKYGCEKASTGISVSEKIFFDEYSKQADVLHFRYDSEYKKYLDEKYGREISDNPMSEIDLCDRFDYWCSRKGLVADTSDKFNFFGTQAVKNISLIQGNINDTFTAFKNLKIAEHLSFEL